MATQKYSRQREAIYNYLQGTKSHPTAETVYQELKKEDPRLSLGTVYRNLNLLYIQGDILKLNCGDGCDRFDATTDEHYHVLCKSCGNVYDISIDTMNHINTLANASFDGDITGHYIYFTGKCKKCLNKK